MAYCIKGGNREDAEEFLGLYLDALDEELVELHTYIRTHMLASTGSAEKLEEGAQQAGGQTKVGKREHTVLSLTLLTYAWTRIGKFSRFAHLSHIRWKVPFDRTRAKPTRHCHYRSLAITQTLYSGPFLLLFPHSTRTCVLVTNLQTLCAARFGTNHSGRTRTGHTAPTRAGRPIQLERGESTGASRSPSTHSCPSF